MVNRSRSHCPGGCPGSAAAALILPRPDPRAKELQGGQLNVVAEWIPGLPWTERILKATPARARVRRAGTCGRGGFSSSRRVKTYQAAESRTLPYSVQWSDLPEVAETLQLEKCPADLGAKM